MGFYIIQGCYTQAAMKSVARRNRSKAGGALVKALGGKLVSTS